MRPRGLDEIQAFTWFMPGPPPAEGCWDWPASTNKGYGQFSMDGGRRMVAAHRASYRKFVGPISEDADILHSCDRPICVQPAHLSPGSHIDNMRQAVERNRFAMGSRVGSAKLTEADVLWIRRSDLHYRTIAKVLGVNEITVYNVRRGKSWTHVDMTTMVAGY